MSKLSTPEVKVIRFNEADVIVASGGKTMYVENLGDFNPSNGIFTFGNYSYTHGQIDNDYSSFKSDFNSYFNANIDKTDSISFDGTSLERILYLEDNGDEQGWNEHHNGTYIWRNSQFYRQ